MPRAKERDGVFQRKDRSGWWVSYVDSSGKRKKEKVTASTRTQAMMALGHIKTRIERDSILGVRSVSEITTADLFKRFRTHQKTHLRPTTFARLEGILETLKKALPAQAKEITRRTVADYILQRSAAVSAGTVAKEFATLRHALQLAVEWELLTVNPAQGAKLPKQSEGRTRGICRRLSSRPHSWLRRIGCGRRWHWQRSRACAEERSSGCHGRMSILPIIAST